MQNVEGCAGWKGQIRPCPRDRRLATVGKPKVVVTTASARGMVGFGGGRRCSDHPQRARVELNLLFNANAGEPAANILMGRPGQILRLYAYRAERRLDPGNYRRAEGKQHRDHPGSGQLRRQRAHLSLRARPDRDDRASRLSARRSSSMPPVAGDAPFRPDPVLDRLVEVIDSALGILRQNRSANPDHQPDGPALWLVVPPG